MKWKRKVLPDPSSFNFDLLSGLAIAADGTIILTTAEGFVIAYDSAGGLLWKSGDCAASISGGPAIGADGTIYVSSHDNGGLCALTSGGKKKWIFKAGLGLSASPTIGDDGTLYVASFDHYVYAVHADGTAKWAFDTGAIADSVPTVGLDGNVYVQSSDFFAFTSGGDLAWSLPGSSGPSNAVGNDGTIYIDRNDGLYALSESGNVLWTSAKLSAPSVGTDSLCAFSPSAISAVYPDGSIKWSLSVNDPIGDTSACIIGGDGTFYADSHAIGADGTLKWEQDPSSPCLPCAIGSDGTLYGFEGGNSLCAMGPLGNGMPYMSRTAHCRQLNRGR